MEYTSFIPLKLRLRLTISQSSEYSMHCLIYSKEKARESSFFLVMSYELCLACQHFILIRANHKLHKKLANQKWQHMSLRPNHRCALKNF